MSAEDAPGSGEPTAASSPGDPGEAPTGSAPPKKGSRAAAALPPLPHRPEPGQMKTGGSDFAGHLEDGKGVPVVRFEGVSKVFRSPEGKEHLALRSVDFAIADLPGRGEFITLLGPSGCGKSTLLNLIAGLEPTHPPTSGKVTVRGAQVLGPGPDRGMVFQSYSSFPCYTVLENVAFGLKLQGVPHEERTARAMEWIKKVRLGGHEHKYPHQLSGGMRQRVAIARSLIMKPRILLMDEPFGALDRPTRWEMQDLLIELWNEVEATVFLVTHDLAEAVFLGDRIFLMAANPGRLAEVIEVGVPTGKAAEAQERPEFQEQVREVGRRLSEITVRRG